LSGAGVVLQATYDWTMRLGASRHAVWALVFISFIESSVFPIPPDVLLIPAVLAARQRAWMLALTCTLASVVGGFAGYAIGLFLYDQIGLPILNYYGYAEQFEAFRQAYNDWGVWIVLGAGFTPFPFKVITIASGATGLDPIVFGLASLVSRGARFFLEAALLWYFGPPIRTFVEGNLKLLATLFFVLLLGGFVVARYVL
jgi:membrane protein YqaA with SNARE-associated domain